VPRIIYIKLKNIKKCLEQKEETLSIIIKVFYIVFRNDYKTS